jgi:uncharacterized membrane protein
VDSGADVHRIVLFSDAVFAIAITLLVLEIKVPEVAKRVADAELPHKLREVIPSIITYCLSFLVIAIFWMSHHRMFRVIRRYDLPLLFLNTLFLMCVALLPFPVALLGHYISSRVAMTIYMGSMAATALTASLVWLYASHKRRLLAHDVDDLAVRQISFRTHIFPVMFGVLAVAANYDIRLMQILTPVCALLIRVAERVFRRRWNRASTSHASDEMSMRA